MGSIDKTSKPSDDPNGSLIEKQTDVSSSVQTDDLSAQKCASQEIDGLEPTSKGKILPSLPDRERGYFPLIEIDFRLHINLPLTTNRKRSRQGIREKDGIIKSVEQYRFSMGQHLRDFHEDTKRYLTENPAAGVFMLITAVLLGSFGVYGMTFKEALEPYTWALLSGSILFLIYSIYYGFSFPYKEAIEQKQEYLISARPLRQWILIFAILWTSVNLIFLNQHPSDEPYWNVFSIWLICILMVISIYLPKNYFRWKKKNWYKIITGNIPVLFIWLVGAFFRFYQLGNIPFIMENDEGMVGVQAINVLNGGMKSMFETFGGYGTLHFFIMAIPVKLFGQTLFSIRILTAIYGCITLVLIYLLAKEMFDQRVALISTALLSIAHLHLQFSRVSPSASSLDPMLTTLSMLFIYRGIRSKHAVDWAFAGLVIGLGLYFYVGARVMIFIVFGFLALSLLFNRSSLRENWKNIGIMLLVFLITAAPMILWAFNHPDCFNARVSQVGIFQNGWVSQHIAETGDSILQTLWIQLLASLSMLFYSHPGWFYQANIPTLGPLTGLCLAFGLLICVLKIHELRYSLLFSWFWVTLIMGQVLQVDPQPSGYRTLGILPAVCILAAVVLVRIIEGFVGQGIKHRKVLQTILLSLILVGEGYWNVWNYFGVWAQQFQYGDPLSQMQSLMGTYLGHQPEGTRVYITASSSYWVDGSQSFDYQRKTTNYHMIDLPMEKIIPYLHLSDRTVFIFTPDRMNEIEILKQAFPGGQASSHYLGTNEYFKTYVLDQ